MIINANGVNKDTNTMRSDAEIVNLIKLNTANMMTRTLLKSISVNTTSTTSADLGTFDINDAYMFEYHSIVIEFTGTFSMTASSSGTSYCYLEMISDSDDAVTIVYMSADKSTTSTVSSVRLMLEGSYPDRKTAGYTRSFTSGNLGIEFDGAFSGYLRTSPSNSPASIRLNGTVNIYGIK